MEGRSMTPFHESDGITVFHGDCREVLASMEEASVDAIVCDPPYEIGFMGQQWDGTGVAYLPETWAAVLLVLKPGGHLLAFGGTRTFHRMTTAIEDAGFEVRDCLSWLYGSGFPKSLDVSKALDKAAGADREVVGPPPYTRGRATQSYSDTRRVSYDYQPQPITAPATPEAEHWEGWGTALKPAWEPIVLARKPLDGTVAATVTEHGTGALNIDGCRIEGVPPSVPQPKFSNGRDDLPGHADGRNGEMSSASGRWPANVTLDDEAAAMLDAESGDRRSAGVYAKGSRPQGDKAGPASIAIDGTTSATYADTGGASRFFYCAKAGRDERPGDHPTVKPIALMRWLVRLVTPPGGLVLDPFAGTGTTGEAAIIEGMRTVLVEQHAPYLDLIVKRLSKPIQPTLGGAA